jgi:hypothetical protein
MIEDPEDLDCWVIPCVDNHAHQVFFTIATKNGQYSLAEIKDKVLSYLNDRHGLSYISNGTGWAEVGTSVFEFWPPEGRE